MMALDVVRAEPFGLKLVHAAGPDAHLGINETWRNGVDEDAARRQFESEAPAELVQEMKC